LCKMTETKRSSNTINIASCTCKISDDEMSQW
jgi:hypothetical protein